MRLLYKYEGLEPMQAFLAMHDAIEDAIWGNRPFTALLSDGRDALFDPLDVLPRA